MAAPARSLLDRAGKNGLDDGVGRLDHGAMPDLVAEARPGRASDGVEHASGVRWGKKRSPAHQITCVGAPMLPRALVQRGVSADF
jgi:hypothetical protein